ncbi:MAG: toxin-antitoxin system HicB family antitoxin [Desulfobacteraceae bacterium]|nr:toxin-antitoxin system HicB family antitoxin [Desulfobacteraceae bacterium]
MSKDLNYYLSLNYTIELVPISPQLGGGFMARLPELGRFSIVGDGDTPQEALAHLEESKRERFEDYLSRDLKIPEPLGEEEYSGKFLVRIPRSLHRELSRRAKDEDVSLNSYVTYLLGKTNGQELMSSAVTKCIDDIKTEMTHLNEKVSKLNYNISKTPPLAIWGYSAVGVDDGYAEAA